MSLTGSLEDQHSLSLAVGLEFHELGFEAQHN